METDTWQVEQIRWQRAWTRANRGETTFTQYANHVGKYLAWCEAEGHNSISLSAADLYVAHVQCSSVHVARVVARAIKAYGKYYADEYETANPFSRLKLPVTPQPTAPHTAMATDADLSKLLATCDVSTFTGLRDYTIITLLAATGLRRSEVTNLTIDDVDLVGQTVQVVKGKTDAARRTVHLPEVAQGALLKYMRARTAKLEQEGRKRIPTGYVERAGRALWLSASVASPVFTVYGVSQMMKRKGDATGVDVRCHAFRRRYAGNWMAKGGSEVGLMAQAGWTSPIMIAHYTKDVKEANSLSEAARLMG